MSERLLRVGTPARSDKRLGVLLYVTALLFVMFCMAPTMGEAVCNAVVMVTGFYLAQSQAGLVMRTRAVAARSESAEGEAGA